MIQNRHDVVFYQQFFCAHEAALKHTPEHGYSTLSLQLKCDPSKTSETAMGRASAKTLPNAPNHWDNKHFSVVKKSRSKNN